MTAARMVSGIMRAGRSKGCSGSFREPAPTWNRIVSSHVSIVIWRAQRLEGTLSLLNRLLGKNDPPKERVRICVECGMPIAQHKDWCSIFQIETKLRAGKQASEASTT
jgi:hypothetical protein